VLILLNAFSIIGFDLVIFTTTVGFDFSTLVRLIAFDFHKAIRIIAFDFHKTSLYYWHRDAQHVAVYGREKRCDRHSAIVLTLWKSKKYRCSSAVRSVAAVWCVKSKIRL
jgi:hypothetical protein